MYLFNDICFLCFASNENIKNVLLQDDDDIVIEDKLKYIFSEMTNFKTDVPKNICINCLKEVNNVYKFKQKCMKNMLEFIDNFEKQTTTNDSTKQIPSCNTKNIEIITEQNVNDGTEMQFSLLFDEKHSEEFQETSIKEESEDIKYEINLRCESVSLDEILGDTEDEPTEKYQNEINNVVVIEDSEDQEIDIKYEPVPEAPHSEINFKYIFKMETTTSGHTSTSTSEGIKEAQDHNQTLPSSSHTAENYKCDICNQIFSQPNFLLSHKRTHHNTNSPPYKCDFCPLTFIWKKQYKRHKRVHNEVHTCKMCGEVFYGTEPYKKHLRTHPNPVLYSCGYCDRKFSFKRDLVGHNFTCTGAALKCEICNKRFDTESDLRVHRLTHSLYQCNLCPYRCETNSILVQHIQTHNISRKASRCHSQNRTVAK